MDEILDDAINDAAKIGGMRNAKTLSHLDYASWLNNVKRNASEKVELLLAEQRKEIEELRRQVEKAKVAVSELSTMVAMFDRYNEQRDRVREISKSIEVFQQDKL